MNDLVDYYSPSVGDKVILNGTLHSKCTEDGRVGKTLYNHYCRIENIKSFQYPYPILLSDNYTDQLGWVSFYDITPQREYKYV